MQERTYDCARETKTNIRASRTHVMSSMQAHNTYEVPEQNRRVPALMNQRVPKASTTYCSGSNWRAKGSLKSKMRGHNGNVHAKSAMTFRKMASELKIRNVAT